MAVNLVILLPGICGVTVCVILLPGTYGVIVWPGTCGVIVWPGTCGVIVLPGTCGVTVCDCVTRYLWCDCVCNFVLPGTCGVTVTLEMLSPRQALEKHYCAHLTTPQHLAFFSYPEAQKHLPKTFVTVCLGCGEEFNSVSGSDIMFNLPSVNKPRLRIKSCTHSLLHPWKQTCSLKHAPSFHLGCVRAHIIMYSVPCSWCEQRDMSALWVIYRANNLIKKFEFVL